MDNWKLQLVVVVLCTLVQTYQALSFSVDKERWVSSDWQDESLEEKLASQLANLIKRSKAHQFYGLMGKRSGVKEPIRMNRRRNKGEMFVGLMGRSVSSGESLTRINPVATSTALDVSEESRKQDLQEELAQLKNY